MPLYGDVKREYDRKYLANRRADFFADKFCVQCGAVERLELDHIDPATKTSHRIWSWSQVRREAEIAKCQVLCHDCHQAKTKEFLWVEYEHGDYAMYNKRGCRCDKCTASVAPYWREYRARKQSGLV